MSILSAITVDRNRVLPQHRWPVPVHATLAVAPALRWLVATCAVPAMEPYRRGCPHCDLPIGRPGSLRSLTPLARCAGCGGRIGAPPLAIEVALLVAVAVLVLSHRPLLETLAIAWWACCSVPLFFIDIAVRRLPDRLTYPAAAGTAALLGLTALVTGDGSAWLRALLAGTGGAAAFATSTLLHGRRGFGAGDAKLALSSVTILGWLGWEWVLSGLLVAFTGSALTALTLLVSGRIGWSGQLPFGPFLILGTAGALVLAGCTFS